MNKHPEIQEIIELEELLHRPEIRRCRMSIENLLATEFVEFGSSGTVYDREKIIDSLLKETDDAGELRSFHYDLVRISNDAVILTYETERSLFNGEKKCALRSSVWKYDGKKWRMLFHQGTLKP